MVFEEPESKRRKIILAVAAAIFLIFVFCFLHELIDLLQILFALLKVLLLFPFELPEGVSLKSVLILGYNLFFGFGLVFLAWMILISAQALLPVNSLQDIQRTSWHLLIYILRMHGQAVFIKDGKAQVTEEDIKRRGPGVVVVDFNSAVVLEERLAALGLMRPFTSMMLSISRILGLSDPRVSPRACGPGIVFTHPNERIRGVVDLRKQFRLLPRVTCYTREGIEIYANILSIFTIGQDPDVLQVTYIGERKPENLRVVNLERMSEGRVLVRDITDDLDALDRAEIHHFARVISHTGVWLDYTPLPEIPSKPTFNKERVFAAVFAQAMSNQEQLDWTDLPTRVAADLYRQILSQINYDDLYDIKGSGNFPLPQHKRRLALAMRNNGILSFRLVYLKSNRQFNQNVIYHESNIIVSEIRPLTSPKVLRDRGIKVIMASFSDPRPVSDAVYKLRLDSWRAGWESQLEIVRATRELEAMKVRSRAHAQAQKELAYSLSRIFEAQEHSDEAIALRIFQALEKAAADPKTRQLLPGNTIDLMRSLHTLILPAETIRPAGRNPAQES